MFFNIFCNNSGKLLKYLTLNKKMADNKAVLIDQLLSSVRNEYQAIRNEYIVRRKTELVKDNLEYKSKITAAIQELNRLEKQNGKSNILIKESPMLSNVINCNKHTQAEQEKIPTVTGNVVGEKQKQKTKPAKKQTVPDNTEKSSGANNKIIEEPPVDIGRLDLRVGKIISVKRHPDAESLYIEEIDCGETKPRTVVSGLVKFIPLDDMLNRMVVILCNLKPSKLRGITSEAMVMCASTPNCVEMLKPPIDAIPGDLVHCEGYERNPDVQLSAKKKTFELIVPDLRTDDSFYACYRQAKWIVPEKGFITSQTLKNVIVK